MRLASRSEGARQDSSSGRASTGHVSLVGAGPGAIDLLTMRAVRALEKADVVFYDALVGEELLSLAPRARKWFVGKRAGRASIAQETITRLLVRAAGRGLRVVRLKAGDPFVFGRGGEEALELARAGVAFEVVPGVSSALAAPAAASIPVTHRGLSSGFVVLTGEPEATWRRVIADLSPGALTLVVLMGMRKRAELSEALLARGWRADQSAAIVLSATHPAEAHVRTTIARLAIEPLPEGLEHAPGVLVIGDVVRVADELESLRAASPQPTSDALVRELASIAS